MKKSVWFGTSPVKSLLMLLVFPYLHDTIASPRKPFLGSSLLFYPKEHDCSPEQIIKLLLLLLLEYLLLLSSLRQSEKILLSGDKNTSVAPIC